MCLGVPGKVTEIWEERGTRMATVDFGGVTKSVCLAYLPDIQVGDYTIIHVGFAITKLDEASALETLRLFDELGVLDGELGTGCHRLRYIARQPVHDDHVDAVGLRPHQGLARQLDEKSFVLQRLDKRHTAWTPCRPDGPAGPVRFQVPTFTRFD